MEDDESRYWAARALAQEIALGPAGRHPAGSTRQRLKGRDRREEAAARAVRSLAAPILAVGARQRLFIRNDLAGGGDLEAGIARLHQGGWHDGTVGGAAAPFAVLRAAKAAARNPAVMGKDG